MRGDRTARNRLESRANLREGLLGIDVAGDDEDRVVGCVPAAIEFLEARPGQAIEGGQRADTFMTVRRVRERAELHVAKEIVARLRGVAQHLLLDRAALILPLALRVEHVAHPVGLDP